MERGYKFAVFVLVLLAPVLCQQSQQNSQCLSTFLTNAMNCIQKVSVNFNHLTYLISNGTTGQMPQEGIQQFKLRACNTRPQADQCGQMFTARLVNSTLCRTPADRQQLMMRAKGLFGEYDRICAHPCRYSLLDELRQCFTYSNLDPKTFIDNAWGQGAVIGTTHDQVYQFCNNQQRLMQCIRQKSEICPDAKIVFHQMGADMVSMEKGIQTLCQAPNVYLHGLRYFTNPNQDVQRCQQTGNMKMQNIRMLLQQTMNENQFNLQTCSARLEQVNCEIRAWTRGQSDTCHMAIIGLRNELECKIMPTMCMQSHNQLYQSLCNQANFHMNERAICGSAAVTWSLAAILLVLIRLFV